MGLDMNLYKKTYVKNWDHMNESQKHQITVKQNGKVVPHIKPERITYIIEEVGYWRKANAIHKWFVNNVQSGEDDCKEHHVKESQLVELLNLCKQIKKNRDLANELLPTQGGFFFGSTNYDDWYFSDIDSTIKIIESVLSEKDGDYHSSDFYYRSSW